MFYNLLKIVTLFVLFPYLTNAKWNKLETNIKENIYDVKFLSQDIGYMVTSPNYSNEGKLENKGCIYKTTDAGANWLIQFEGDTLFNFRDVHFINNNIGFAIGYIGSDLNENEPMGLVMKTIDGGNNWVKQENDLFKGVVFTSITFFYDTNLVIAGGMGVETGFSGVILKSIDNGQNWESIDIILENMMTVYKIEYISHNSANMLVATYDFVRGLSYSLYNSKDGLYSWNEVELPYSKIESISDFNFINQNIGYIVGTLENKQVILKTIDGGNTWNETYVNNRDGYLSKVLMMNENTILAVGVNLDAQESQNTLIISNDGGNNWREYVGENANLNYVNNINIAYKSQYLFGDFMYVVGNSGILYRIKITNNPTVKIDLLSGSLENFKASLGSESEILTAYINFEDIEDTVNISINSDNFLVAFEEPTNFRKNFKLTKDLANGSRLFYILYKPTSNGVHESKLNFKYFTTNLLSINLKGETLTNSVEDNNTILIYPNPTNDFLKINKNIDYWKIITLAGSIIKEGSETELNLEFLPSGNYYFYYENNNKPYLKIFSVVK